MKEKRNLVSKEELNKRKDLFQNLYYSVYVAHCLTDSGEYVSRPIIVLKDEYGLIWHWTRWGTLIKRKKDLIRPVSSDSVRAYEHVAVFLNHFLCDRDSPHHIKGLKYMTKPMMQEFFQMYAFEKTRRGTYRQASSVQEFIMHCTDFVSSFCSVEKNTKIKNKELWRAKEVSIKSGKRTTAYQKEKIHVPDFQITVPSNIKEPIFRDIPDFVLERLFDLASIHMPQIVMPMALGAYAGLRPGECCQVQQEEAGGMVISYMAGSVTSVEINLTKDKILRSDGLMTGCIKKYRRQKVYHHFLPLFMQALEFHQGWLEHTGYEAYRPLLTNEKGMAMTSGTYRQGFHRLVQKFLKPSLLEDPDPICQQYGQMLMSRELSPHALRHWFSVKLVLLGENAVQLKYYRGDSCMESAFVYLSNKSELNRQYQEASSELLHKMLEKGEKYAERGLCYNRAGDSGTEDHEQSSLDEATAEE